MFEGRCPFRVLLPVVFGEFYDVGEARFPSVPAVRCSDGIDTCCGIDVGVNGVAADRWKLVEVATKDEVNTTVEFVGFAF
jgi:hypothetical protein